MSTITVRELKEHLSMILSGLSSGEEVVVTRHGKPCAIITAVPAQSGVTFGRMAGTVELGPEFEFTDDELNELIGA